MRKSEARIRAEALALSAMIASMNVMPALADTTIPEIGIESTKEDEGEEGDKDKDLASPSNATPVEDDTEDDEDFEFEEELENDLETEESTENEEDTESSESEKESSDGAENESLEDTEDTNEIEESTEDIESEKEGLEDTENETKEDTSEAEETESELETEEVDLEQVQVATPSNLEKPELISKVAKGVWMTSSDGNWQIKIYLNGDCCIKPLSGEMKIGDVIIPEEVDGSKVVTIGANAWQNCEDLTSIDLPDGITVIEDSAFEGCISLDEINLTNVGTIKGKVFKGCTSLTEVNIPSITNVALGGYVFQDCSSLEKVDMPNLTSIAISTFQNCTSLTEINMPNVKIIAHSAFKGCISLVEVDIPNVTEIDNNVFMDCTSLTEINMPNVKKVDPGVFYGGSSLIEADMPNVTYKIEYTTFTGCISLKEVNIPNVKAIGDGTFKDCSALKRINMPNVTKSIEKETFKGCISLVEVDIPNITSVKDSAFQDCTSLTEVNMPNVVSIEGNAFNGCSSLAKLNMPNVRSIGWYAFLNCSSLTEANIGTIESLGRGSFAFCENLSTLNWTNKLKGLSALAFYKCESLEEIDLGNITYIGEQALFKCNSIKELTIPAGVESVYLTDLPGEYDYSGKADLTRGYKLTFLGDTNFQHYRNKGPGYPINNDDWEDSIIINELVLPSKECKAYKKIADKDNSDEIPLIDDTKAKVIYHAVNDYTKLEYEKRGEQNIDSFWEEKKVLPDNGDKENQHTIIRKINVNGEIIPETNKNTVTFYINDGTDTIYKTEEIEEGNTLDLSSTPTRDGFEFIGWYKDPEGTQPVDENEPINEDTELYAGWKEKKTEDDKKPEKIKVTYYLNDGTPDIFKTEEIEKDKTPSLDIEPKRDEYKFIGWYKDPEATQPIDENTPISEDTRLYAGWEKIDTPDEPSDNNKNKKKVTYYTNDGTDNIYKTEKIDEGKTPDTSGKPERKGYEFIGWFKDPEGTQPVDENEPINEDTELYAGWKKKDTPSSGDNDKEDDNKPEDNKKEKVTITYHNNNGTEDIPKIEEIEKGRTPNFPEVPDREGYEFIGWYEDPDCKIPVDPSKPLDEDTEYYAGWKKKDTDPSGNGGGSDKPNDDNKGEDKPDNKPEDKVEKVKVTYHTNDDTDKIYKEEEIEKGGTPDTEGNPDRDKYEFTGWYLDPECKIPVDPSKPLDEDTDLYAGWKKKDTIPTGNGGSGSHGGGHGGSSSTVTVVNVHEDKPEPDRTTIDENGVPKDKEERENVDTTRLDENGVPKDKAEKDSLPKTGDSRNIFMYMITFISSLSSMMFMGMKDKMKKISTKKKD